MSANIKAPTLSDGSIDVQVSRDKSQGEHTMMDFIRKHMGEILRPFAEHLDQLHKAVGSLGEELEENNEKTDDAHKQLAFQMRFLTEVRSDLDRTTDQAKATQAGLEQTNVEKAALEADHRETKLSLGRVSTRLSETMTQVDTLNGKVEKLLERLGKVEQEVVNTKQHITTDLEPVLKKHGDEISKLETDQQATARLLTDTKIFGENAHREFLVHVEDRARLNKRDQETFDHIHGQMSHMSTMLNENINRVGLHANHLKTTNGLVRPLKAQVEELVNSTHVMLLQQRDSSTHVEHLQGLFDQFDSEFKAMKSKFGEGDNKGANLYQSVADLDAKLKRQQASLLDAQETLKVQHESRVLHDRRLETLEEGTSILQQQTKGLQEQVGFDGPAAAPPPPMNLKSPKAAPAVEVPAAQPKAAARGRASLLKFQNAVHQMSIKERMRDNKKRLDAHDQELAAHVKKLSEQKYELDLKGQRVTVLERDLANANKMIEDLKSGLELTEEYWKGLSSGFRETHKTVNINNELLPKGNVTLPSLQTPRSARGSMSHTR